MEARRGFFKAYKEDRRIEAEAAVNADSAVVSEQPTREPLASSGEEPPPAPDDPEAVPVEPATEGLTLVPVVEFGQVDVDGCENGPVVRANRLSFQPS